MLHRSIMDGVNYLSQRFQRLKPFLWFVPAALCGLLLLGQVWVYFQVYSTIDTVAKIPVSGWNAITDRDSPGTDFLNENVYHSQDMPNLTFVGVVHSLEEIVTQRRPIITLIHQSDIALFERGTYFEAIAKTSGVDYQIIDANPAFTVVMSSLVIVALAGAAIGFFKISKPRTALNSQNKAYIRPIILLSVASLFSLYSFPSGALLYNHFAPYYLGVTPLSYSPWDFSVTVDGRTEHMWAYARQIAALSPSKKVVVVTGILHEKGAEWYETKQANPLVRMRMSFWSGYFKYFNHDILAAAFLLLAVCLMFRASVVKILR